MSHIAGPSPDAPATIPSPAAKDPGVRTRPGRAGHRRTRARSCALTSRRTLRVRARPARAVRVHERV